MSILVLKFDTKLTIQWLTSLYQTLTNFYYLLCKFNFIQSHPSKIPFLSLSIKILFQQKVSQRSHNLRLSSCSLLTFRQFHRSLFFQQQPFDSEFRVLNNLKSWFRHDVLNPIQQLKRPNPQLTRQSLKE